MATLRDNLLVNMILGARLRPIEVTAVERSFHGLTPDSFRDQSFSPTAFGSYYARSSPVYTAITLRSDAVSDAFIQVMEVDAEGNREPLGLDHPAQALFAHVNPWWTQADLLAATETNLLLWGQAFWFIERDGSKPVNIWSLRPDQMKIVTGLDDVVSGDTDNYILGYEFTTMAGKKKSLKTDEVLWFRRYNPLAEFAGLSPVAPARQTFDMGIDGITFNRRFFTNSAQPQGLIFFADGPVSDEERQDFYDRLDERFKGAENAYRPMIWDKSTGSPPVNLGLNQRDMEFMDTLKYTIEDAARVFNVPRELMGEGEVTFSNRSEANKFFFLNVISREWRFIESEINELMMPVLGFEGLVVQFNTEGVRAVQDAEAEQDEALLNQVEKGIITINEFRERDNREPVPWGDVPLLPLNIAPLGSAPITPPEEQEEAWTDKALDAYSEAFVKTLETREREFASIQRKLFEAQGERAAQAISNNDKLGIVFDGTPLTPLRQRQIPATGQIFNPNDWIDIFEQAGGPFIENSVISGANEQAGVFNIPPIPPDSPAAQQWAQERTEFWATSVNQETAKLVTEAVDVAVQNGESVRELEERIRKIFKFNVSFRTERIARTEMLAATSRGHQVLYQDNRDVVPGKQWITTLDERTRGGHVSAHKQIVQIDERFSVSGEMLEAPGLGGSAFNVINCRCASIPVLETTKVPAKV